MKALTFKRGVHPPDSKEFTNKRPIEILMPEEGSDIVVPMSQHIGAPCEPIVAKGDRVLLGQKIAESGAFVSAPIHASVSGVVKEIKPVLTPGGSMSNAIIITNDGKFEEDSSLGKDTDYEGFSKEKIIEKVKKAGIVGLGGAGFPTHIKLNPGPDKKIDSIIVNAAECEPYLTTDHRVLLEKTDRVIKGLEIVLKIHPEAQGYIAVENNKPDAIEALIRASKGISNVSVVTLQKKYPQGSEKQMIYAVTKREVPSGKLPADVGCIVDNVDTILAIERAVVKDRPLMRRIVTLSGGAVKNPGNYQVRLGMSFRELIEMTGGFAEEPAKVIAGGPMMGVAVYSLDVPLIKTSSAILCLTREEAELPEESNCIRCGKCVAHCPMGLMPLELNGDIIANDYEKFEKNHGLDCIECGSCSYVCPAKRHLAQSIRVTKRTVMAMKKKK
ncbi:MAG: electron transport complex subunit RsxC [Clostridiales bacterium]|nr:electron transport complex subunit RsxC [Clostridiales bacterium]